MTAIQAHDHPSRLRHRLHQGPARAPRRSAAAEAAAAAHVSLGNSGCLQARRRDALRRVGPWATGHTSRPQGRVELCAHDVMLEGTHVQGPMHARVWEPP
jgi:hypothetical protein